MLPPDEKALLRRQIRESYPGAEARQRESERLCAHVLRWQGYRQAKVIGAYMPMPREADVMPILRDVLAHGKTLLLPRVEGEGMTLRVVRDLTSLHPGEWGIPEPGADAPIVSPDALELLIVPLEGIDREGMRLGKGKGYYDRLLAHTRCMTLGAVMSWQWQEHIPARPWDRPLQAAADQNGIYLFDQRD